MTIEIRRAGASDLPLVLDLLAAMDGDPPLEALRGAALLAEMSRYPHYAVYLAWEGARAVGTFSLLIFPTLVHDGAAEALVEAVVVDPSRRGEGIGKAMMVEAMRMAAAAGCYKLVLSSNDARSHAHGFYAALGFRRQGVSFWVDPGR